MSAGFRYREFPPPAALLPFVECLWIVRDTRGRARRTPEQIVPDGCPELIAHLGDPFRRHVDGRWRRQQRVFLAGTLSRPWRLEAGPRVRTLGVRFRPGAFGAMFGGSMRALADREVPIDRCMPAAAARALKHALEPRAGDARLAARVAAALAPYAPDAIPWRRSVTQRAVRAILTSRGRMRIEAVARDAGASRRSLERRFAEDLGLRPKLYARIVRLNAALVRLGAAARESAVDTALDAGYFDQAHLSRDFRAVAGRTVRDARAAGALSSALIRPERLLAMLAGE